MKDPDRIRELVRDRLDRHSDGVDELAAARLAKARKRALAARRSARHAWRAPAVGGALAASLALAALLIVRPTGEPSTAPVETVELLTAEHPLELYEDLDFYLWLETQELDTTASGTPS